MTSIRTTSIKHTIEDGLYRTTIKEQVELVSIGIQANAYVCLELVTYENSVGSCTPNCDNIIQKNNRIPIDNISTAVVCVMIAATTIHLHQHLFRQTVTSQYH